MEVALILYMCSAIEKTCLDPYNGQKRFMINMVVWCRATKKVLKKIAEVGRKDVNQYDLYIKFECTEFKIILPKPKPKITT